MSNSMTRQRTNNYFIVKITALPIEASRFFFTIHYSPFTFHHSQPLFAFHPSPITINDIEYIHGLWLNISILLNRSDINTLRSDSAKEQKVEAGLRLIPCR